MKPLRICLDARLVSSTSGGIEQVVIGLASGLSNLSDGDEEYLFLVYQDADDWIRPFVNGPCRLLQGLPVPREARFKQLLKSTIPFTRGLWHKFSPLIRSSTINAPESDGIIESACIDIMHFTSQRAFITSVPNIYHPHDLQHLHLPQFFTQHQRLVRESLYRTFCEQASMVAMASSWGKRDIIQHYKLPGDKVHVVPLAPVNTYYPVPSEDDLAFARQKFSLPEAFIFYPAQTWAHKNHFALLEALAILRDHHGLIVPFVSSGHLNEFYSEICKRAFKLQLVEQIRFLGFVSPLELQCLYKMCRFVVIPTKFEAASFPLWEAFLAGAPAACSNVTSLPEQAGDAALIFDPYNPGEIADTVRRLWTDETLRKTLITRGKRNVERFTWKRTVRTFRAHYRRLGNRPLTEEDRDLIETPPLL